ncbi:50S ribosomal protein L18 [Candidatus Woesearchaeota archaeon]|nr:50S ribosomal protein L18 [Candidatus Woesearchaeota archaeon]
MKTKKYVVYRRKREGKTDYKLRLSLLKSEKLRLVVRKSLKNILVQANQYESNGDKTLLTANSKELEQYGWKGYKRNVPAAYLTGFLFGTKAKKIGMDNLILDKGLYVSRKGTIIYSVLKGVVDAGVNVPHSPEIFPKEERIKGKHISDDIEKMLETTKNNIQKVK